VVLPHLIGEVAGTALSFGDWFIGGRSDLACFGRHGEEAGDRLSLASWRATRTSGNEASCAIEHAKRKECRLVGDTVTHTPTGKWFRAYPGMPDIFLENMVDIGEYSECEIRQMAALILADRLKHESDN
jgi:hypothetical protein